MGEAPQHFRYDSFGGVLDDAGEVTGDAPDASVSHGYTVLLTLTLATSTTPSSGSST